MKHRNERRALRRRRVLAAVLGLSMVFALISGMSRAPASAAVDDTGLCEHHPAHTPECGYVPASPGSPCTHVHDETCGYVPATEEIPCDQGCVDTDGDGVIDHVPECAYTPATEGSPCAHVHDGTCGYAPATEGSPCTYVCPICDGQDVTGGDAGTVPADTPAPDETEEPEATEEPGATEEPEPTEEPEAIPSGTPFGDGMLAFASDEEALAYLWSLEGDEYGVMPIGEMPDKVPAGYFRFAFYTANEESLQKDGDEKDRVYTYDELQSAFPDRVTFPDGHWTDSESGPDGGNVREEPNVLNSYPTIQGYTLNSIQVNGTTIYHLGMYQVKDKSYVHFTTIDSQGRMTTVVLTGADPSYYDDEPPFEVRYVPREYDVKYQIYMKDGEEGVPYQYTGGGDEFTEEAIFGQRRPLKTVNQWFATDVTIPGGYVAQVYIGNEDGFTTEGNEKYPSETGYGDWALGAPVVYKEADRVIDPDTSRGPGFYSLTGTYASGEAGSVSANQVVRVVLRQRTPTEITFNPTLWMESTEVDRRGSLGENVPRATSDGDPDKTDNHDGSFDFTWSFTTTNNFNPNSTHFELRSMSINGKNLNIPFINTVTTESVTAETVLPSGAKVTISVTASAGNGGGIVRRYTIAVTGAKWNITITGGSLNNDSNTYYEVVIGKLLGVDLEMWRSENSNNTGYAWRSVPEGTSLHANAAGDSDFQYDYNNHTGGGNTGQPQGNIRFKLQEGYEWESDDVSKGITFVEKTVDPTDDDSHDYTGAISDPDSDGWYYTTLSSVGTIGVLRIEAQAMQYAVYYHDGRSATGSDETGGKLINDGIDFSVVGNITDMPVFTDINEDLQLISSNIDDNHKNYYSIGSATGAYGGGGTLDSIVISDKAPSFPDAARPPEFLGWVVTNAQGRALKKVTDARGHESVTNAFADDSSGYYILEPSDEVDLQDIYDGANVYDEGLRNYVIHLTALWNAPAEPYRYFVTFNYTDPAGVENTRVEATVTRTAGGEPDRARRFVAGDGNKITEPPLDYDNDYYVAMRDTYFTLEEDEGLSVVFDPDTIASVEGGGNDWKWYKYDNREGMTQNGSDGDIYKWTDVKDGGEVDVWFISTLGRLTIGKTVDDLFPTYTDPADAVRADAKFTFDVSFALPENDGDTDGNENEYFGTGGSYSVKYTLTPGATPGVLELSLEEPRGDDVNTYTGTLTLQGGQTAAFDLPAGTEYTVTEKDYEPDVDDHSGIDFKLTGITNNRVAVDAGSLADGASGEVTATASTAVQFTNAPTGAALTKAESSEGHELGEGGVLYVGSGETVTYTITVYNYDVDGGITVKDEVPDADEGPGHRKLRVHRTSFDPRSAVYEGEAGTPEQAPGEDYGGVVTWEDLVVPIGTPTEVSFQVSTPIVLEEHSYTNTATAEWGVDQSAESNPVTVTVYEDWLRIGKVALDADGQLIAPDQEFTFTLTLTLPDEPDGLQIDNTYSYVGRGALGYEDMEVVAKGRGTVTMTGAPGSSTRISEPFTLKAGQAITIYGIAPDIRYSVAETPVPGYQSSGMQARTGTTIDEDGVGTIDDATQDWVYFINTSTMGTLAVSKTVPNGPAGYANQDFTFDVTFTLPDNADRTYFGETADYTADYTLTGSAEKRTLALTGGGGDRVYTGQLTLKAGQTASFQLPAGTGYTIEERETEGYYNLSGTRTGSIETAGQTYRAAFVNVGFGGLTISKTVTGDRGETDRAWDFTVALTGVDEYKATAAEGDEDDPIVFDGGIYSFQLKSGESVTIENLPAVEYTVTEADANQDGYTTVSAGARGTIPSGGTATASFVNDRSTNKGGSATDGTGSGSGSGSGGRSVPDTGDSSRPALWLALAGLGLAAAAAVPAVRRLRRRT